MERICNSPSYPRTTPVGRISRGKVALTSTGAEARRGHHRFALKHRHLTWNSAHETPVISQNRRLSRPSYLKSDATHMHALGINHDMRMRLCLQRTPLNSAIAAIAVPELALNPVKNTGLGHNCPYFCP